MYNKWNDYVETIESKILQKFYKNNIGTCTSRDCWLPVL